MLLFSISRMLPVRMLLNAESLHPLYFGTHYFTKEMVVMRGTLLSECVSCKYAIVFFGFFIACLAVFALVP